MPIEYMNANKLEQDHPCVIQVIRRHFLRPPSSLQVPYSFAQTAEFDPNWDVKSKVLDPNGDPSQGQIPHIVRLLRNMVILPL